MTMRRPQRRYTPRRPRALEPVGVDPAKRYRWLGRWLLSAEPGSTASTLSDRIRAKRDQLDKSGKPIAARLAELEAFLIECGVYEQADRFANRFATTRSRQKGSRR